MRLFNIFKRKKPLEAQNAIKPYGGYYGGMRLDLPTSSTAGVNVTESTAWSIPAVYACVRLIAGDVSTMPLKVFERKDGVSKPLYDHDYWYLLNESPHPNYTATTFFESLVSSLLLQGDAYARIVRNNSYTNKVQALDWLHPNRVLPFFMENGSIAYRVTELDGSYSASLAADMLHIPGLGFDGLKGLNPIQYSLRTTLGIATATNQQTSAFFENGARPDYAITFPEGIKLTAEDQKELTAMINAKHGGSTNAFKPLVLQKGGKLEPLVMSQADTEALETRAFQAADIARFFGVAPHLIGIDQGATTWGTGIESMNTGHVSHCLLPIMAKIENEINRKFWPSTTKHHTRYDASGLVRGDYKSRMESYRSALGRAGEPAFVTINEVRLLEGLPPIEGGDKLIQIEQPNNDARPD